MDGRQEARVDTAHPFLSLSPNRRNFNRRGSLCGLRACVPPLPIVDNMLKRKPTRIELKDVDEEFTDAVRQLAAVKGGQSASGSAASSPIRDTSFSTPNTTDMNFSGRQ
jgi:hypothetical protein